MILAYYFFNILIFFQTISLSQGVRYEVANEFFKNSTITTGWSSSPSLSSCTKNIQCNGDYILGGRYCLGYGNYIQKTYSIFHHWQIRIQLTLWFIDEWRNTEYIQMDYSGFQFREYRATSYNNYCGSSQNDYYKSINVVRDNHFDRSMILKFTTNNSYTSSRASFAITKLLIQADTCNPSCEQCFGGDAAYQCRNCPQDAYLTLYQNSLGFCKCKDGYYTVSKDVPCTSTYCMDCLSCHNTCFSCSSSGAQSCIKCSAGYVSQFYSLIEVNNNKSNTKYLKSYCQKSCFSTNYYVEPSTNECIRCHSDCATCDGYLQTECTTCVSGFLDGNTIGGCVDDCGQGYYKDTSQKKCKKCSATCLNCFDNQPTKCQDCRKDTYLYNNNCLAQCPDGFWNDSTVRVCQPCLGKCSTCIDGITCSSCNGTKFFYENDCLENSCPNGFYKKTGIKNNCLKCESSCLTCDDGTHQNCISCDPSYGFLRDKMCSVCLSSQYGSTEDQKCYPCSSKCLTCDGPNDINCRSCSTGFFLTEKQCKTNCPSGTWPDSDQNICQNCHVSCKTCTDGSSSSCQSCSEPLFLKKNMCIVECDITGEYPDTFQRKCNNCHDSCYQCDGDGANNCINCAYDLYFYQNQCLKKCPNEYYGHRETLKCENFCKIGFYKNKILNMCDQCDPLCPECSDFGLLNCFKCNQPLYLNGKECISQCPLNKYPENSPRECILCHKNCMECNGPTEKSCTKCKDDQFFYENQCFIKCPNKTFGDENIMQCVPNCPAEFYGDINQNLCKLCNSNCSLCYGQQKSQCKQCQKGYYLLQNTCDDCPLGYFKNEDQRKCEICSQFCQSCDGPSNQNCLKCSIGNFFIQEKKYCNSQCPSPYFSEDFNPNCVLKCSQENQFPNQMTRKCEKCNLACSRCTGSESNQCIVCSPNFFFLQQQSLCTKNCPDGYFGNIFTMNCEPCHKSCAKCIGKESDQCTYCQISFALYKNQCFDQCPDNLYQDEEKRQCIADCTAMYSNKFNNKMTKKCQKCHYQCSKCTGPHFNQCQKCITGYFKYKTSCLQKCENGTYPTYKNNSNYDQDDCLSCDLSCLECYGPQNDDCRSCKKDFFSYKIKSKASDDKIKCVEKCPSKTVEDKQMMSCNECSDYTYFIDGRCERCTKCFGPLQNQCLQCSESRGVGDKNDAQNGICQCKFGFSENFKENCSIEPTFAQTSREIVSSSAYTACACSAAIGLIANNMFSIYSVLEVAQFTSYFSHVNLTYPMNADQVFDSLYISHFTSIFTPTSSNSKISTSNGQSFNNQNRNLMNSRYLSVMKNIDQQDLELWKMFLPLIILNILSWVIVVILNLLSSHMKILHDNTKLFERLRVYSSYSLPIQVYIRTSQESFLYIFLSLLNFSKISIFDWINVGYLFFISLLIFGIIVKASFIQPKISKNKEGKQEYIQIIKGKKTNINQPHPLRTIWILFKDNKLSKSFYLIFLIQKLLFVLLIVLSKEAKWQSLSAFLLKLLMSFFLVVIRPYKSIAHNAISIFNEIFQVSLSITIFFYVMSDKQSIEKFGWLILVQLVLLFTVNCIYVIITLIILIRHTISQYYSQKQKATSVSIGNENDSPNYILKKRQFNTITPISSDFAKKGQKDDFTRQYSKNYLEQTDNYIETKGFQKTIDMVKNSPKRKQEETLMNQSQLNKIEEESQIYDNDNEKADIVDFPLTIIAKKRQKTNSLSSPIKRNKLQSQQSLGNDENNLSETYSQKNDQTQGEIESIYNQINSSNIEFNNISQTFNKETTLDDNYDIIQILDQENTVNSPSNMTLNTSPIKISNQTPFITSNNLETHGELVNNINNSQTQYKTQSRLESPNKTNHIILSNQHFNNLQLSNQTIKQVNSSIQNISENSPGYLKQKKDSVQLNKTLFKLEKVQDNQIQPVKKTQISKRYSIGDQNNDTLKSFNNTISFPQTPQQKLKVFQSNTNDNQAKVYKEFKIIRTNAQTDTVNRSSQLNKTGFIKQNDFEFQTEQSNQVQHKSIIEFIKSTTSNVKSINSQIKNTQKQETNNSIYVKNNKTQEDEIDDFGIIDFQNFQQKFIQNSQSIPQKRNLDRPISQSISFQNSQIKTQKSLQQRRSRCTDESQNLNNTQNQSNNFGIKQLSQTVDMNKNILPINLNIQDQNYVNQEKIQNLIEEPLSQEEDYNLQNNSQQQNVNDQT